jgi:hypothetical protein
VASSSTAQAKQSSLIRMLLTRLWLKRYFKQRWLRHRLRKKRLELRQGIDCDRISYNGEGPWGVDRRVKRFLEIVQIF